MPASMVSKSWPYSIVLISFLNKHCILETRPEKKKKVVNVDLSPFIIVDTVELKPINNIG